MTLIDFSEDREDDAPQWEDFFTLEELEICGNNLWEIGLKILEKGVILPYPELQLPFILGYTFTPSAMATRFPLAFFYGPSGSGKSNTGIFCSRIYGEAPLQESATTSALRNEINARKWVVHPEDEMVRVERNTILVWDDLRPVRISPLGQDNIFSILKSGCSRQTSITKTATVNGKTNDFCTFSGKIISSISAIWSVPGAEELQRRSFVFKFQKSKLESELLPLDLVDLNNLTLMLSNYWFDRNNRLTYRNNKKQIGKVKSAVDNPFFKLSQDVLTTMLTMGGYGRSELVELFDNYNALIRLPALNSSITDEMLDQFLLEREKQFKLEQENFIKQGFPEFCSDNLEIHSSEVQEFLKLRIADGSLDLPQLSNATLHLLMQRKGFKPRTTNNGVTWVKQNEI